MIATKYIFRHCFSVLLLLFPISSNNAQAIFEDSVVTVAPGPDYAASRWKTFWFGEHYRDVWTTPVDMPLIDLNKSYGGLTPTNMGGGQQTISLKLKGEDGRLYTFRSIQKDPTLALPKLLRPTIADDVVQDQISAEHPYGAFILPIWLEKLGLYHTNPKLVFIPGHPRLGKYREKFAGMVAMLEEDADENWENKASFGYTKNAVSTETLLEDLRDDNDNSYDEWFLTKGRLFDMWIGDWDRHDGQWRWAEFEKEGKGLLFRQIPEDRDNAFFKFDGVLPWLANRKWAVRKFQSFETEVRDMKGLNYNARYFDRTFLTELELPDWLAIADTMQNVLTDEVIERAVKQWPDTIYALTGEEIIYKLKERRNKLKDFARRYYKILAREVDVRGSDKHELFKVERVNNDSLMVLVYKTKKDGEVKKLLYERVFKTRETKEIRLYGFEGKDQFIIDGDVQNSILVRIIGGEDADKIKDRSHVKGWQKKTLVYDNSSGNELILGNESKDLTSDQTSVNEYNRKAFKYNYLGPLANIGFNTDDGIFLGGGALITTHGFRKEPFATNHKIKGKVAIRTGAFQFGYRGTYTNVIRNINLYMDLQALAPRYQSNYFGLGNNTEITNENDERFYSVRYDQVRFKPSLQFTLNGQSFFTVGPSYQYVKVEEREGRFVTGNQANLTFRDFQPQHYGGMSMAFNYSAVDDNFFPHSGLKWKTTGTWQFEIQDQAYTFSKLQSSLSLYYTFDVPTPVTLAIQAGGATILGDFPFHQAATLGGSSNLGEHGKLRGYRRDRFAGRTSFYQNAEIRIELTDFQSFLVTGKLGIMGVLDHGRVWIAEENSDKWHRSYGGGIWISPFHRWVITANYYMSQEEELVNINAGFAF